MRQFLTNLLIRLVESDLAKYPKASLTNEQTQGMLGMLWDNNAFRNYVKDRNSKLVYTIAGVAGEEPEETHSIVSSEELQEQNNRYLKFSANRLREIVEYVVRHKVEILVNPPDFEIIKVPIQERGSGPTTRVPRLMTVYA